MGTPFKRDWKDLEGEFIYSMNCREEVDNRVHLPFIREVAKGNVLEIGVDIGNSTTALLLGVQEKGGHVISIDIRKECEIVYEGHPQWTFMHTDGIQECTGIKNIDVLYIDGDHSYEGIMRDFRWYMPSVKQGGIVLVHDVDAITPPNVFPGVLQAFNEVTKNWPKNEIRYGSNGLGVIYL